MYITSEQKKLISDTYGIRVKYSPMWEKEHQIGYCYKDHDGYHVKIDTSQLNRDMRKIVLLHELGHIDLDHLKINEYKEKELVDEVIEKVGAPKDIIYKKLNGGFHDFLNICMDLEVNSKYLTFENIDIMRQSEFKILNIEDEGFEYQSDYRGYYEPVIRKLMTRDDCEMSKIMNQMRDWAKSMQQSGENGQSEGQIMSDSEAMGGMPSDNRCNGSGNGKANEESRSNMGSGTSDSTDNNESEGQGSSSSGQSDGSGGQSDSESSKGGRRGPEADDKDKGAGGKYGHPQSDMEGEHEGDDKSSKSGRDSGSESTVGQEFKDDLDAQSRAPHKGYGSAYSNGTFELTNTTSLKLRSFLTGLISRQNTRVPDSMKLYNRGIRRNKDGLMYTSTRTKRNTDQMKLGILIDVSGSMDIREISAAINSLGELKLTLHPQSKVVLWSTDLNQEWSITDNFPRNPNKGGGTDMLSGIRYLLRDGYTDIVVYSDWETPDMDSIIDLAETNNIYSIFVAADMKDRYNIMLSKKVKKFIEI